MPTSTNARWYDDPKGESHNTIVGVFQTIRDECSWRVDADEYHAGLYAASDRPGVRGNSHRGYEYGPATLPYNVCRGGTDTLVAKVAKHRPLPQVLTQKGNWKNQKRARKMTQFLEGEFYRQRIYERWAKQIVRDACIFGRGALKIWTEGENVRCERAHVWEIFADEWDARYDDPRNLYHIRSVDRGVLLQRYARGESGGWKTKLRDAINNAGELDVSDHWRATDGASVTVDRVDVLEAWHLPSTKGGDDGRHVVVIQGATLIDEPWEYDYFPFAFLNYADPLTGTWGHGLVEQLEGYQYEINACAEKVSQQFHMSGVGVIVADGSHIHDQELRNGITILKRKAGAENPVVFQMDLVNEHMRQRPRELVQDGLNDIGVSQMSAQSEKPAGITAAVALQTLDDIETERFMIFGRAYEAWNLEVARRFVDCAKEIANDYGDLAVSVPMKGGLLPLNWNDVCVDDVELRISPSSMLATELPARLQKLTDLFNTGQIDGKEFLREMSNPDLQAEIDLVTADRLVIDEMLERMSEAEEDEGEAAYMAPSAYQDLAWGARRAQQRLNRGLLDGMPEFNQQLLRDYIEESDAELKKLAAANAPPPPMGAVVPPPGASPVPPAIPDLGIPGTAPPMAA